MTDNKIKHINQPGDYYFCSLCAAWHRCTNDPSSNGNQHLSHLEENETNSPQPQNISSAPSAANGIQTPEKTISDTVCISSEIPT